MKEMLRSEIKDRRLCADGSVVVTGFCAGGKSTTAADRQPFFWYVDSHMGVTGTTNLWLWDWAGTRLGLGWMFPQYTLSPRDKHVGAPWLRACQHDWVVAATWNRLLSLPPIELSDEHRLVARSTAYSIRSCMPSLARALSYSMPGLSVLDRTRLGRWSLKQQTTEVLLSLVEASTVSAQTAVAAVGSVATRSHQASAMSERYSQASASEVEECMLRRRVTGAGRVWLQERGVAIGEMPGICINCATPARQCADSGLHG